MTTEFPVLVGGFPSDLFWKGQDFICAPSSTQLFRTSGQSLGLLRSPDYLFICYMLPPQLALGWGSGFILIGHSDCFQFLGQFLLTLISPPAI